MIQGSSILANLMLSRKLRLGKPENTNPGDFLMEVKWLVRVVVFLGLLAAAMSIAAIVTWSQTADMFEDWVMSDPAQSQGCYGSLCPHTGASYHACGTPLFVFALL